MWLLTEWSRGFASGSVRPAGWMSGRIFTATRQILISYSGCQGLGLYTHNTFSFHVGAGADHSCLFIWRMEKYNKAQEKSELIDRVCSGTDSSEIIKGWRHAGLFDWRKGWIKQKLSGTWGGAAWALMIYAEVSTQQPEMTVDMWRRSCGSPACKKQKGKSKVIWKLLSTCKIQM